MFCGATSVSKLFPLARNLVRGLVFLPRTTRLEAVECRGLGLGLGLASLRAAILSVSSCYTQNSSVGHLNVEYNFIYTRNL